MRRQSLSRLVLIGVMSCVWAVGFLPSQLSAQVIKGSISGNVVDPSGAAVPGAEVSATNKGTGGVSTTTTETTGAFVLPLLPVGTYRVEITKAGFQKLALDNVQVSAGQDYGLGSVALKVGQVSTTVEVSAASPLLQTSQAQVTTSISGDLMQHFAGVLENQGLDNLALQVPGVNNTRDNSFSNSNGVDFAVNGIRGRNNDQQIDGQNNNDNSVAGPYLFLSNPDFVEEYQIITNNFGPEYGRNSGSVVNIITKSGTNNWHGDIFGTEGNSALNSLSNNQKVFEKLKKPPRFNDEFTGGSVGGPIIRDKAFLFGGFDDEILSRQSVYSTGSRTPTPTGLGQMAACYPGSAAVAALQKYGPYGVGGGNPTVSGTPTTATLTDVNGNPCPVEVAGVKRTLPTSFHEYDSIVRIDVQGAKDHVYGRWLTQWQNNLNTDAFGTAAAGYPANVPSYSQDFGLSWTRTFTPRMVNEFRFSYGRLTAEFGGNSIGNTVPNQTNLGGALARVVMPRGFLSFGPLSSAPQGRIVNTYQLQDNWTYIFGKHQLKAGMNYTYQRSPNSFLPNFNGTYNFSSLSNFGLNNPSTIQIASGNPSLDFRERDSFFYFGDDYRIRPNLVLNLGLTYSYFGQPANLFHKITVKNETGGTPLFNPALPLSIRTFPSLPAVKTNWGPSVGFAYTPHWGGWLTGNGKMVLRGGYRRANDPPFYNIYLNIASSTPVVLLQTLTGANATANPLSANPFGPAVRSQLAPFLTFGVADPRQFNQTTVTPNFGPDHVDSWSFGIQRELGTHAVYEVRYIGNHGGDLFQSINKNPRIDGIAASFPGALPSGVTPCADSTAFGFHRVNCNSGVVRQRTNTGVSDYNGLQMQLRASNLANQLSLFANYTWSKTTDNVSEIFSTFAGANSVAFSQNPLNFIHAEHGLSGLDVPQNFSLAFHEEIPLFRAQHGWLGHALGGWSIAGNYILSSGQPYSPVQFFMNTFTGGNFFDTKFDTAFIGTFETARPFLSNPNAPVGAVGIYAADACNFFGAGCGLSSNTLLNFNTLNNGSDTVGTPLAASSVRYIVNGLEADTVFGTPFGSAGRNTLRDYHVNTANFALFKTVRFNERSRLQWWVSFTNVFNHPNFSSVDPFIEDAGLSDEGTGFADPRLFDGGNRSIHFGIKIFW